MHAQAMAAELGALGDSDWTPSLVLDLALQLVISHVFENRVSINFVM